MTNATDALEVARLAALPPLDYDRERFAAAEHLGCRVATLDALVIKARGGVATAANGQGRPLDLLVPAPWPRPVNGAALLGSLARAVRRHVVLGRHEADAVALWVLATHAFDAWVIFPRLFATAPESECGKTTLLDALSRLVPKPLSASSITAAALFRTIEAVRPTLFLDEADAYAREKEELRAVLDAGHRRDGAVIRTVGEDHEPRQFSVWSPLALAAIGRLPGTVEGRSIVIRLRRRRADEAIQPFRLDRAPRLEVLARLAARWTADNIATLAATDPSMPDGIHNRVADNWRPLLAVADCAGGEWHVRARVAAVALLGRGDGRRAGVQLLADLRELFDGGPSGKLFVKDILQKLTSRDDRRWSEWGKNRDPITGPQVAALLRPFDIRTNQTVRKGDVTDKGYKREWLEDAFTRYLPPSGSVTQSQASIPAGFNDIQPVTPDRDETDAIREKSSVSAGGDRVTDRDAESSGQYNGERSDRDPEPFGDAGIPFVVTARMRGQLRELGYTDEEIRRMTPSQAWQLIGGKQTTGGSVAGLPSSSAVTLSQPATSEALHDSGSFTPYPDETDQNGANARDSAERNRQVGGDDTEWTL